MSDSQSSPAPRSLSDGLPPQRRLWAMTALMIGLALATLDTAIANTALPTIAVDLDASASASVWIVNAYQLAMLATLLPLASLGEIVGHRRVYIVGLALFTVASLACGLSWSLPTLAAARVLQGLGAAAMMSVSAAVLRFIYPASMLGRAVGTNALVVGLCFAIGPSVASAILSVAAWPWLFAVNVPFGLVALVVSWPTLPHTHRASHGFDGVAAILAAGFFAPLMLGIGEAAHEGPLGRIGLEWAVALGCLLLLLRRQADHPAPMLAIDLFRRPVFTLSVATAVCSFAAQGLAFVSLPFLLETVLGRSQVQTGFLMTPWPVVVAIMAPIAGRLADRYPAGLLGGLGLSAMAIGMALLALMPTNPDALQFGWRMAVCGVGFGFFQSPNLRALMSSAPPERSGGASGIIGTARLFGQAGGAALVAACFAIAGVRGPLLSLWLGAGFAAAGCVASFLRLAADAPQSPQARRHR